MVASEDEAEEIQKLMYAVIFSRVCCFLSSRLVQSLISLSRAPLMGVEPGHERRESRITCMRMHQFFPQNQGKKTLGSTFENARTQMTSSTT